QAAILTLAQVGTLARTALPLLRSQVQGISNCAKNQEPSPSLEIDHYILLLTAIASIDADDGDVRGKIAQLLDANNDESTSMVLMKVWQVGQPAHGLLPVVKGRVRSQSSAGVRVLYLQVLSQFPSTADPTFVLESLSHGDTGVRTQAAQTLEDWKEIP